MYCMESDLFGLMEILLEVLYGIVMVWVMENYYIMGTTLRKYSEFIRALVLMKKVCVVVNWKIGLLLDDVYCVILFVCDELIDLEEYYYYFAVDVI